MTRSSSFSIREDFASSRATSPRLRLKPILTLLPVFLLAGCGPYACFGTAVEQGGSGNVTIVNEPKSAAPDSTITLDLTGSTLPGHCIYSVTTTTDSEAGWTRRWVDTAQDSALYKPAAGCDTFHGTIQVPIPATFTGDNLTVRIASKAQTSALLFTSGTIFSAQRTIALAAAAPAAPVAPTARVFPHYLRMVSTVDAARTIDARTSTDPQGQALTYTWDTNNDGVFGDAVEDTGVNGVVRIPAATLNSLGNGTHFVFGVKATNTSGLSSTATAKAEVIGTWADSDQTLSLSPTTGVVGSTSTVTLQNVGVATIGCVDSNGDDVYTDATIGAPGWSATFTAVAGTQRIAVIAADNSHDCAYWSQQIAAGSYGVDQVVADAYTAAAARSSRAAVAGYRAKARFSLGQATMVALGSADATGSFSGTTGRGTYTLTLPARGNGSARPAALTRFRRGDYVVRAGTLGFFGSTRTQTVIGQSTMLLRGTGGALLCLAVTATPKGSTYVLAGGTGPAARLTGDASSTRLLVRATSPKPPASGTQSFKGKKQKKPIRSNATVAAGTAATATPLPAACAALKRYLP